MGRALVRHVASRVVGRAGCGGDRCDRHGSPGRRQSAPPVRPTLTPVQSISVVVPARDEADADRAAAGSDRRRARRRRGDRGRRPVERCHRRAGTERRCHGDLRDPATRRLGRQGLGAAAGHRGGHVRLGRHPRRRRTTRSAPADGPGRTCRCRPLRPAHRRRSIRMSDARKPVAASSDADHAGLPVRPARDDVGTTRSDDGQRSVHGGTPHVVHGCGCNGARARAKSSKTSRWHDTLAGAADRVGFLDASDLLSVRMFESLGDAWTGWGRSLALPGVEPPRRQLIDLADRRPRTGAPASPGCSFGEAT